MMIDEQEIKASKSESVLFIIPHSSFIIYFESVVGKLDPVG